MRRGKRTLRFAIAQINPTVGDLTGNIKKITHFINRAKENDVDVVAFPEQVVPGYPAEDLLFKKQFLDDNKRCLRKIVPETSGISVVIGCIRSGKGKVYNSAALISDRKIIDYYSKIFLPNYGVFDEKRYFDAGKEQFIFIKDGFPVGVNICEDMWVEKGSTDRLARCGAQAVINLSASPYHFMKRKEREELLKERAQKNKVNVIYVNMVGGQDEIVFDGGSLAVDRNRKVIASAKQFEEDLVCFDLEIPKAFSAAAIKRKARKTPLSLVRLDGDGEEERKPVEVKIHKPYREEKEIYEALVLGTRDYVRKNGFQKVVFGLSGGIDSSLVAAIAADALGAENVTGVFMPSRYTTEESKRDAKELVKNLKINYQKVPIDHIYGVYLNELRGFFTGRKLDITEENIQARIRGNILMAFSNKFGWLVLTTGNKSETSVGYCTLYGDMAGGFAVIKDVMKEWVYKLALHVNMSKGENIIPLNVIKKEPTAELRKGQRDSDSLPPYPSLDPVLKNYIEKNKGHKDLVRMGFEKRMSMRMINLVDANEYKRRQAPPGVKITPLAFGKDRRYPITNRYRIKNCGQCRL
ncbi:NAD+ synthase [Candidatus Auribacterota bacterium]